MKNICKHKNSYQNSYNTLKTQTKPTQAENNYTKVVRTIAEYTRYMPFRISEEQYQKFKHSQYDNFSDFARDAIDSYDMSYIDLKIKLFKEFKELCYNQLEIVTQNIVTRNEEICNTIENLEQEKENLREFEDTLATVDDDFEERVREIIPTLQRLKHGENGLTNSNIEFQAKKIGVDTSKLKKWINNHHEIVSKKPTERVYCKCNDEGGVYRG